MVFDQIDRAAVMAEAKSLLRSAEVSPRRMALLLLALTLLLNMGDAALTPLFGDGLGSSFFSMGAFLSVILTLFTLVLEAGFRCYCLGVHRREEMQYDSLFEGFAFAGKVVGLFLLELLLISFWSMLLFVPGVIAFYRYSFAMWDLCQNPELGVIEALMLSRQQTRGYKLQLFGLHLSFLPLLLPILALNLGYDYLLLPAIPDTYLCNMLSLLAFYLVSYAYLLYVKPYFSLSECGFYLRATAAAQNDAQSDAPSDFEA